MRDLCTVSVRRAQEMARIGIVRSYRERRLVLSSSVAPLLFLEKIAADTLGVTPLRYRVGRRSYDKGLPLAV